MANIITAPELKPEDMPEQNVNLVMLAGDRYVRASAAMEEWAATAKKAIDYLEGRQWTAEELAKAEQEGRPALTYNKMAPLARLVLGYFTNNRIDPKFIPDDTGVATEAVASGITKLCKRISENNQEPYIDSEITLDGLATGRGFYDHRLSFEENILGEIKVSSRDPFTIKLDPDGEHYNLNESCVFVQEDRMVGVDEIELVYGKGAAALVWPLVYRSGYAGMPTSLIQYAMETITPWRTFGGQYAETANGYMAIESYLMNCFDRARKSVRLVDMQHKVKLWRRYLVDMETGDKQAVPDSMDDTKLKNIMAWSQEQFARKGKASPLRVIKQLGYRMRWTTLVGDIVVYDQWSPYETFTITGYFPYFRRGKTRGMLEDLIDPQDDINKHRSANTDIVMRAAHSGWKYHETSLTPEEQDRLERYGAAPGFNMKWKGQVEPKKIETSAPPMAFERLEQRGADDLKEISGINNELLGMDDTVKSGRAIEARQRQGVMAVQIYMDNNKRTKELCARKKIEIIQSKYTEQRVYRIIGDQGKPDLITLNQRMASGEIVNNVAIGKYKVQIDETPLSASFAAAQFDEAMELVEKGVIPKEIMQDVIIDASSMPHKDAIKKRAQMLQKAMGLPTIDEIEQGAIQGLLTTGQEGNVVPALPAQPAGQPGQPPGAQPGQPQPAPAATQ